MEQIDHDLFLRGVTQISNITDYNVYSSLRVMTLFVYYTLNVKCIGNKVSLNFIKAIKYLFLWMNYFILPVYMKGKSSTSYQKCRVKFLVI